MIWRVVLPLATLATLVHAGGRSLSPQESAQFLSLFRRYCQSGSSGPNQDGNTFYYCKTSDQPPQTQQLTHEAEISAGETPKQVIFVQPPPTNYIHSVALRGSPGNPQETEIYVLPQTAEHQLQLQDTRSAVQAQKPSLYFLSSDQNNQNLPPIGRLPGQQGGNGQRPSAPPPGLTDPTVIGVGNGLGSQGGYQGAYGAPGVLSPRNQRNARGNAVNGYRTL